MLHEAPKRRVHARIRRRTAFPETRPLLSTDRKGEGLEVDIFDLLAGEARRPSAPAAGGPSPAGAAPPTPGVAPDYITMGRWQIDPASGKLGCDWKNGFAYCRTGGVGAMAPRGLWTCGQRMFEGNSGYLTKKRPRAAFRGGAIFSSTDDHSSLGRGPEHLRPQPDRAGRPGPRLSGVWVREDAMAQGGPRDSVARRPHGTTCPANRAAQTARV